jgi:hypothetical protein
MSAILYQQDGRLVVVGLWEGARETGETPAAFGARMAATMVPAGLTFVVVDEAALPSDAPPERWSVNWSTGAITALPPPAPTEADYGAAIQAHIEATARLRGYNDAVTCASYATSQHPVWGPEARAFVAWRDAAWTYAFGILTAVQTGQRQAPTVEGIIAELDGAVPIQWTQ